MYLLDTFPLCTTVSNVDVFHTTTAPVDVLTAVSVPAVNVVTANWLIVPVVIICDPAANYVCPTYSAPAIPAPPATINAPELVLVALVACTTLTWPVSPPILIAGTTLVPANRIRSPAF